MQRALTHSSARGASFDNERLEFLGDRVLGLVVTDMLFRAWPEATQGELAVRLSFLVSGAACAEIADEIGLTGLIHAEAGLRSRGKSRQRACRRAGSADRRALSRRRDGGRRRFHPPLLGAARHARLPAMQRDAKTELQEWAHQAASSSPVYQIDGRDGPDHEPLFIDQRPRRRLRAGNRHRPVEARGRAGRRAGHAGARGRAARAEVTRRERRGAGSVRPARASSR